ncbi:hypothetical protein B0H11DRAFT_1766828 [Mycena galericulata]|nr:hypothetical protein B0H11DRAFT_1766828 [Mycena galericulata]
MPYENVFANITPDLAWQFAPRMVAFMKSQLELLDERVAIGPPFPGSAFSTTEFNFGDAPMHTRKHANDVFHGFRAITVLGVYNPDHSNLLIVPGDDAAIRCPPGATVLIPCTKDYFFTKVGRGEKRYLFQQYFHSGVQRWLDRGFRSDMEYDLDATPQEKLAVEAHLANRVAFAAKLFNQLHEMHV